MAELIPLKYIIAACIFSTLGVVILFITLVLFDRLTPGHLWHEIGEKQNVALAITVAGITLAVAQIIASAIHG